MKSPFENNLYEVILDAINAGVWVWDIKSGEEWWSDKYYKLLGYEPGEIKPSYHAFIYELVHEDDRYLLIDENKNPILTGIAAPVEIRLKQKDGSYKWFEVTGKLVFNANGHPIKMTGSIIDRDANKTLQLELQQSLEVIGEQNKRLNNFAHIVSHNLRSHAANIQAVLPVIEDSKANKESLQESLSFLSNISAALNETISHLDEVVKIQTAINLLKAPVTFKEIFDSVITVLTPAIKEFQTIITADFSEGPQINYVYAYLESIMLNLISNAIKYRHPERKPEIHIKTFTKDEKTFLEITDNGLGIDLIQHKDKLFGMYKVFHKHADAKGIGLFITKNQIESLGGTISVKSEPEKGSCFLIQF
ncbi:MAG: PAS domain-containing sensor histidine kinase [Panacibacter sp.]